MEIQFGKNPEITLSVCWNVHSWAGTIMLPFGIGWFNQDFLNLPKKEAGCLNIGIWLLGIRFGLEIWRYGENYE